jgi:hypothetical protein
MIKITALILFFILINYSYGKNLPNVEGNHVANSAAEDNLFQLQSSSRAKRQFPNYGNNFASNFQKLNSNPQFQCEHEHYKIT